MTPDLEEMIRQRAHAIWEQEGRPHGRHEEHWQMAASEITQELEHIKAAYTPATAEEIEAPTAPRKGRQRRTEDEKGVKTPRTRKPGKMSTGDSAAPGDEPASSGEGQQDAPRRRGRKAAGEAQAQATPAGTKTTRRRTATATEGAQTEPASDAAPKTRRSRSEAAEAGPDTGVAERPARRGRRPKAESETLH